MNPASSELRTAIAALVAEHGLHAFGISPAHLSDTTRDDLQGYLAGGHHGEMDWMARRAEQRGDPVQLWPEARSVIVIGHSYAPAFDPMERLTHKDIGVISAYALGKDYHDTLKKKIRAIARTISERYGCDVKIFVDTAPVMEKPLAAQTAIGWQGKHTCIVSRQHGSWLFLGEIFTTLELEPDAPHAHRCGTCTRCLDVCPTDAFLSDGKLDATRCIAYLTIEHKGIIPEEFRKAIGNRIYGCDDCLAVCPWNSFAAASREISYHPKPELFAPSLRELAQLDDVGFRAFFSGSPVKRIGRDRFVRNVLIAIGNSADPGLLDVVEPLCADENDIVRDAAHWARAQLTLENSTQSPTS